MSSTPIIPQRFQRVLAARWMFGLVVLIVGLGCRESTTDHLAGCLLVGLAILLYNGLFQLLLRRLPSDRDPFRLTVPMVLLDSVATVAAIHYGLVLTPAVQFLFLFPLFVATLLCPRSGLFLTAAFCSVLYALAELAGSFGWWRPGPTEAAIDPTIGSLAASGMVLGALLAAATMLNYLVRTLAGIEQDLAHSEAQYRHLAGSLEDEVRRRTSDLRLANEELNSRNRELTRLQDIDAAIHGSVDLGTVLQRVVDGVAELVPDSQAVIYLLEPGVEQLRLARFSANAERRVAAIETLLGRSVHDLRVPLRDGTLIEYAVRTGEMLITDDAERVVRGHLKSEESLQVLPDVLRILNLRAAVALPLDAGEQFIGLLALGSRTTLQPRDVDRIKAFATQAAIAVARVQTERNLVEQRAALEQAYRELERSQEQVVHLEKMRAIGEMTSGVAHNFNNALMTIMGNAQILLAKGLPQELHHKLRIVEQTAQDAALLVERIRAFTRQEPPTTSTADMNELVKDSVDMTEPRWRHHQDRVESPVHVRVEAQAGQLVDVDAAAIREVLVNIILNAVNVMPDGGHITARTYDQDEWVVTAIRDDGPGMDEDTRRRCFEPFFTTRGPEGTGLGLSVAYGIMQRHGGSIRCESQLGGGTEFILTLPAATTQQVNEPAPEEALPDETPAMHALIVDDQAMVRETLSEMLEALGHSATIAADGQEAMASFDPDYHRVVITDWGMPGMSGLAVARAIKARSPHTPVVLVTGFDANLPPEVLNADEIDSRMQKPVALRELARTMATVSRLL